MNFLATKKAPTPIASSEALDFENEDYSGKYKNLLLFDKYAHKTLSVLQVLSGGFRLGKRQFRAAHLPAQIEAFHTTLGLTKDFIGIYRP